MATDSKNALIKEWGQIRFVCACQTPHLKNKSSKEKLKNYSFDIVQRGISTFYHCREEKCGNDFPTEYHLKAIEWLNSYYNENGTYEGFVKYFRVKECRYKVSYLETVMVTDEYHTVLLEITNMTKQYRDAE